MAMNFDKHYHAKRRKIRARARAHMHCVIDPATSDTASQYGLAFQEQEGNEDMLFFQAGSGTENADNYSVSKAPPTTCTSRGPSSTPTSSGQALSSVDQTESYDKPSNSGEMENETGIERQWSQFLHALDLLETQEQDLSDPGSDIDEDQKDNLSDSNLTFQLGSWAVNCNIPSTAVSRLLSILKPYHPSLPKDPRTLCKTPRETVLKSVSGGSYFHFGIKKSLSRCKQLCEFLSENHPGVLSIQINIDGLPLFHSACKQFWPILGRVSTPIETQPFLIGLFCGDQKPTDVGEFLEDFVDEMLELQRGPTSVDGVAQPVQVHLSCFICDTPARAFVKQVKGHSGYFGCDKCAQEGVWDGKVIFPDVNCPPRTDVAFDELRNASHKIGESPLRALNVGMVSQFPIDYMHLVCLGVMRRLLWYWTRSPVVSGIRVAHRTVQQMSANLLFLKDYIPREFSRKCRSLSEMDRWKATEFRLFLLFTGIVVLKKQVSDAQYKHFLLFFVAIFCLVSPELCITHTDYAGQLLTLFVQQARDLYGSGFMVYNVHGLSHIAADVKMFGPLDSYSAFPFENFLGQLKRLLRKPGCPLQQVIRRVLEKVNMGVAVVEGSKDIVNGPKKEHFEGPVPLNQECRQFKQIYHNGTFLSCSKNNNCVKIDDFFYLIRNIVVLDTSENVMIVVERFLHIENFFTYPLNSLDLGIVKAANLSGRLEIKRLACVDKKYVLLPYQQKFVLVPLGLSKK